MAMIKCPDCRSPISDSADACPSCGCKYKPLYNEMIRLRNEVHSIERMQKPTDGQTAAQNSAENKAIVGFILLFVAGIAFAMRDLIHYPWVVKLAFWLCAIIGGISLFLGWTDADAALAEKERNGNTYNSLKASLPEKKRRLAYLESRFR